MALSSKSRRRGLMAEINVVPYIDVMLVLVVILMVASPACAERTAATSPGMSVGCISLPARSDRRPSG